MVHVDVLSVLKVQYNARSVLYVVTAIAIVFAIKRYFT